MPRRHQIPPDILPGPHQIPGGFLFHARHGHRDDLPEMQQPGQMPSITDISLDPIPRRALQLRRRRHQTPDAFRSQKPGQPEPGRAGLIGHRDRPRQRAHPRPDLPMIGSQAAFEQLTGLPIQPARHHRACVHIQSNTRTIPYHWGLPHLWHYRPGRSCRQPTITCERGPSPNSHTV